MSRVKRSSLRVKGKRRVVDYKEGEMRGVEKDNQKVKRKVEKKGKNGW